MGILEGKLNPSTAQIGWCAVSVYEGSGQRSNAAHVSMLRKFPGVFILKRPV